MEEAIVIVGGTTGLGFSAAVRLLREGASVVVVGRSQESLDAALKDLRAIDERRAEGLTGDAGDPATAVRAVERSMDAFGRLDGLYHVAGGSGRRHGDGPLDELTDEGIEVTLRHNLASVIYSNRAAVRSFLERGVGGSVVNMGSVLATSPSRQYFATAVYAAAKAGIEGFTRACAARYARDDVRFNVVAPALVDTPMATRAVQDDEINRFVQTKQPLDGGRVGAPEDLDGVVRMLLSRDGRFITGQVIKVDGGWSVSEGQYG